MRSIVMDRAKRILFLVDSMTARANTFFEGSDSRSNIAACAAASYYVRAKHAVSANCGPSDFRLGFRRDIAVLGCRFARASVHDKEE